MKRYFQRHIIQKICKDNVKYITEDELMKQIKCQGVDQKTTGTSKFGTMIVHEAVTICLKKASVTEKYYQNDISLK